MKRTCWGPDGDAAIWAAARKGLNWAEIAQSMGRTRCSVMKRGWRIGVRLEKGFRVETALPPPWEAPRRPPPRDELHWRTCLAAGGFPAAVTAKGRAYWLFPEVAIAA